MVSDAPAIPPARSLRAIGGLLVLLSMVVVYKIALFQNHSKDTTRTWDLEK